MFARTTYVTRSHVYLQGCFCNMRGLLGPQTIRRRRLNHLRRRRRYLRSSLCAQSFLLACIRRGNVDIMGIVCDLDVDVVFFVVVCTFIGLSDYRRRLRRHLRRHRQLCHLHRHRCQQRRRRQIRRRNRRRMHHRRRHHRHRNPRRRHYHGVSN